MSSVALDNMPGLLPGNAKASIVRMNGTDVVHHMALDEILYRIVESEAVTHGASADNAKFGKVIEAIKKNKIQAYFAIVEWENCSPKLAGGSIEFPTVLTERNGRDFRHYPAIYGEDTYVSPELSQEFRNRTKSAEYPNGIGLGSHFIYEKIRRSVSREQGYSPYGLVSRGRVGEYAGGNAAMTGIFKKLGATMGAPDDSAVLEFIGDAPIETGRSRVAIQLADFAAKPGKDSSLPNVFLANWQSEDGNQKIAASFTEAISTFLGEPIVRAQITSNGNLPKGDKLKDVVAALISTGRDEVSRRKWIPDTTQPLMRIHALNEPEIVSALKELGASPRALGPNAMLPLITDFSNVPNEAVGLQLSTARPLSLIRPRLAL